MTGTFTFALDLDNDGAYGYDITSYVMAAQWNVGIGTVFAVAGDDTRCQLTLNNGDKRFSPEYASSPYFGLILPQRRLKITSNDGVTTRTHYVGYLEGVSVDTSPAFTLRATMRFYSAKRFYDETTIRNSVQVGVTADVALLAIADSITYPPDGSGIWLLDVDALSELDETTVLASGDEGYDMDTGEQTFAYIGDAYQRDTDQYLQVDQPGATTAYNAMSQIAAADAGRLYFNRLGQLAYRNISAFQLQIALDATFNNTAQGVEYLSGDVLKTVVEVKYVKRTITAAQTLYTMAEPITLEAGESKVIRVNFDGYAGSNMVTPNAGDGSLVVSGSVSVTLEDQGTGVEIALVAGTACTITTMIVTGTKYIQQEQIVKTEGSASDIAIYGRRVLTLNLLMQDNLIRAEAIARHELIRRQIYNRVASITTRDESALALSVVSRVRVVDSQTAHDEEYYVIGEQYTWAAGDSNWSAKLILEPALSGSAWVLDDDTYSILDDTTILGL